MKSGQKKRNAIILIVGFLLLIVACAAKIAGVGSGAIKKIAQSVESGENIEEDSLSAEDEEIVAEDEPAEIAVVLEGEIADASVTKTFTITATGDCTFGITQNQSYEASFYDYYDTYGEDYFFQNVRSIFEADDLTLINLECVLSDATERVEKTFNLKGKPSYVGIMTGSSVEACSMGNNHTYDYGEEGFVETKEVLDEAQITYAYSGQSGTYVTEDGVVVGIVSANIISESEEKLQTMVSEIETLREEGAEVIVACCHWGIEKDYYPTTFQQTAAHTLIDAGADLVIGNHPHVLQGVEVYEGKVICYSLGNFSFGGNKNPSDKNTMIYQQTFTIVDGEVQTDLLDAWIIPCRLSSADSYNDFQPVIASGEKKETIISLVNQYSAGVGTVSFTADGVLTVGEE